MAEKLFSEIDMNGNGKLEESEVRTFSERMLHRVKPDQPFD